MLSTVIYGRLVHWEHVITRGDQLLPPGDETGPGRMDCITTAPETAQFILDNPKPSHLYINVLRIPPTLK